MLLDDVGPDEDPLTSCNVLLYLGYINWNDFLEYMLQVTKECLDKAISICAPGVELKKIGKTIQWGSLIFLFLSFVASILPSITSNSVVMLMNDFFLFRITEVYFSYLPFFAVSISLGSAYILLLTSWNHFNLVIWGKNL